MEQKPIIGIIGGTGKFGSWFKNYFKNKGLEVLVSGRSTELTHQQLAQKSDIVFVCVPIRHTAQTIKEIREYVRADALLSDFTGLKVIPMEEMLKSKSGVTGLHPMFGPLVPNLAGQNVVFCSGRDNHWTTFLKEMFAGDGAKIIETTSEEHDHQMAIVQALVHFINLGFAQTLVQQNVLPVDLFSSPNFRMQTILMARILTQQPELSADMQLYNPMFPKVMGIFKRQIDKTSMDITLNNPGSIEKDFKQAAEFLSDFSDVAQVKSQEIVNIIDHQPIKVGHSKKITIENATIGFLGPQGTHSHQAAKEIFKNSQAKIKNSITEVFQALINNEIEIGIVPAENSTAGMVTETIYNLVNYPVAISGSYDLLIHHYLLGRTKDKNDLKVVMSHQQALNQCAGWLEQNLSAAKKETMASTIKGILTTKDPTIGFIASKTAAETYNLNILAEKIEDDKANTTKFFLITNELNHELAQKMQSQKTLLLLAVYDRVGVLRDILSVFSNKELNLSRLHSIPSSKAWDYYFYILVDENIESEKLKNCLKELEEYCSVVRVLGAV